MQAVKELVMISHRGHENNVIILEELKSQKKYEV